MSHEAAIKFLRDSGYGPAADAFEGRISLCHTCELADTCSKAASMTSECDEYSGPTPVPMTNDFIRVLELTDAVFHHRKARRLVAEKLKRRDAQLRRMAKMYKEARRWALQMEDAYTTEMADGASTGVELSQARHQAQVWERAAWAAQGRARAAAAELRSLADVADEGNGKIMLTSAILRRIAGGQK